jgi:hypothetical protein
MESELIEHLAVALAQAIPDIIEHVLSSMHDGHFDLGSLSGEALMDIAGSAILFAGGKVLVRYAEQHPEELRGAIHQALAAL